MREEERLKTALRDMNMSLTMERMRVQDLINSQAKVMEFFTWAVKARTRARTIARFFMRYIVLIYCKVPLLISHKDTTISIFCSLCPLSILCNNKPIPKAIALYLASFPRSNLFTLISSSSLPPERDRS